MTPAPVRIDKVLLGPVAPLAGTRSGIAKRAVGEPVWLSAQGLASDQQADLRHHGGPEKALHHYPHEHYAHWARWSRRQDLLAQPGAFGENLSSTGLDEGQVCIGDVFALGGATVQLSQGRQPCWKLDARFGEAGLARQMQAQGRTGWYYRVLKPGWLQAGDGLQLLERPHLDWPLARVIGLMFSRDVSAHAADWRRASELPDLAANWRQTFARRLESGQVEDWSRRLDRPSGI
jgi:MOSC domain-containing protein YiiM